MVDISNILPDQIRTDFPKFNPGDRIRVQVRVIEGDKERLQNLPGMLSEHKMLEVDRAIEISLGLREFWK